jgi:hypothetical protein
MQPTSIWTLICEAPYRGPQLAEQSVRKMDSQGRKIGASGKTVI